MLRLFTPILFLGLLISVPAAAWQASICGEAEKDFFCTSTRGYLTFEKGEYVLYPDKRSTTAKWQFLYITTSEKVHTATPVFPPAVKDALPKLAADTVLTGNYEFCVLVPLVGFGANTPGRKTLERVQQEKTVPAKLCRAWQLKPLAKPHVENELLARRGAVEKTGKTQPAGSTRAPEIHVSTQSTNTSRACRESALRRGACSDPIRGWVYRRSADNALTFVPLRQTYEDTSLPMLFHVDAACRGTACRGNGPVFQLSGEGSADGIRLPEALSYQFSTMDNVKSTAIEGSYVVCPFKDLGVEDFRPTDRAPGCIASVSEIRQVRKVSVGKASVSPVD